MGDRVPVFISFLAGASHSTTNAPLAGKLAEGRVPTAAAPGIMWPMAVSNTPFPESHPPPFARPRLAPPRPDPDRSPDPFRGLGGRGGPPRGVLYPPPLLPPGPRAVLLP